MSEGEGQEGMLPPDPPRGKAGRAKKLIPRDKQQDVFADLLDPDRGTNDEIRTRHGLTTRQLRDFLDWLRANGHKIPRYQSPRGERAETIREGLKGLGSNPPRGAQAALGKKEGVSRQRVHQLKPGKPHQ